MFRQIPFGAIEFDGDSWVVAALLVVLAVPLLVVGFRVIATSAARSEAPAVRPARAEYGSARRSISRRRSAAPLVVFVPGATAAGARLVAGWVLRRSPDGLCLTIGSSVDVGVVLRLRHRNASRSTAWTLVEAQKCELRGGCWELDCRFLEPDKRPHEATQDEPANPTIV